MKHALVGGGTGFIGKYLISLLKCNGYKTSVISRMPSAEGITWLDLERRGINNDVTHVINLAGQNALDPKRRWTEGFKQNVWNSRINSTCALRNAIANAPNVEAFVNISGVHHYKACLGKCYTEDDEVEGFDFMSKLAIEWEKSATLPPEVASRCRSVIIRSGVVLGRGGGMIESILMPFKMGVGGAMGSGKQAMPWIHIVDLCYLIQHAMENKKCEGVMNGVAPEIVTNEQFSKEFARALHRPCLLPVPEIAIKMIFGEDRAALLLTGAKIAPKKAFETGFTFKYPTAREACEEIVNVCKEGSSSAYWSKG